MEVFMRHFYKSLLLVVLFAVVCTAYAEEKPETSDYDKVIKQYKFEKNGDTVFFSTKEVPYKYNVIYDEYAHTDIPSVVISYGDAVIYGDGITNSNIDRDGFSVIIKNGADFIMSSYKLTEGLIDTAKSVEPVYLKYDKVKFTVNSDSVVLEANGKTITGDQIIFNKNNDTVIVKTNSEVKLIKLFGEF
jgi:ABC-type phosphate transport system substrate-binding protein